MQTHVCVSLSKRASHERETCQVQREVRMHACMSCPLLCMLGPHKKTIPGTASPAPQSGNHKPNARIPIVVVSLMGHSLIVMLLDLIISNEPSEEREDKHT